MDEPERQLPPHKDPMESGARHPDRWEVELQQVITSRAELEKQLDLTDGERKAADALAVVHPVKVPQYYLGLVDAADPEDPIRKIIVPSPEELRHRPGEEDDDVEVDEARYQPCAGVIHRYPGKVLLLPTLTCPCHCRFCYRKSRIYRHLSQEEGERALWYIASSGNIRDVIITGGEPLCLSDERLEYWLSALRSIDHVEIVRLTTRLPAVLPSRFTPSLIAMLARYRPLYVVVSFVHPKEITPEAERALRLMADAGLVMLQQGPLLRGVNDDPHVLRELFERLAELQVLPYYAIWGIHAPGAEHFLVGGERASRLIGALENKTSGFCVPHLITIARGDKVRMMGWSPEKEVMHLAGRRAAAKNTVPAERGRQRVAGLPGLKDLPDPESIF